MTNLFLKVLELSILGSILALIVMFIRHFIKGRMKRSILYLLWLMVFVKFLIPIDVVSPLNINVIKLPQVLHIGSVTNYVDSVHDNNTWVAFDRNNAESSKEAIISIETNNTIHNNADGHMGQSSFDPLAFVAYLWLIGLIVSLLIVMTSYIKGRRTMNLRKIPKAHEMYNFISHQGIDLHWGNVDGPLVIGGLHPKIVLPSDYQLDKYQLKYILAHEEEHVKFHDNLVNALVLVTTLIHWFNPIAWMSYSLFRKDLESFCDERVIKRMGEEKRTQYAEAIVTYAGQTSTSKNRYALAFGQKHTKGRIKNILISKKWNRLMVILACGIIGLVSIGFFLQSADRDKDKSALMKSYRLEAYVLENPDYQVYKHTYSEGMKLISNGLKGDRHRIGFANVNGKILIEPEYLGTFVGFNENLAFVMTPDLEGQYINNQGQVVIEKIDGKPILVGDLFRNGYAVVSTDQNMENGQYVIDQKGNVILEPTEIGFNYSQLGEGYFTKHASPYGDEMIGVVNVSGQLTYQGQGYFYGFNENDSVFHTFDDENYSIYRPRSQEFISEAIYYPYMKFIDQLALVKRNDGNVLLINQFGETLLNFSERFSEIDTDNVSYLTKNRFAIPLLNAQATLIVDEQGNIIAKTDYDSIKVEEGYETPLAICQKGDYYGYVDFEGNEILEPIYDYVTKVDHHAGMCFKDEFVYVLKVIK